MVTENVPDVLDATREKDYVEANSSTRSELCIGLIREGKLLGVLVLKSSKVGAFSKEDERLCELVAHQVAVALERASEVAEKRVSDYLTGAMAWAADVAHDINVDVGYIRYRTSWLLGAVQEEEQREWVREIDQRAGELADKARDDRSERKEAPVLLSPFLEKKVREWHVRHSPDTRIVYDWCSDAEVAVKAYPEQIWKAVRHLLRNAIEAMHHQGRIDLRLHPVASEMMELQVENSGPDIPPEVRERIFREPFTTKNSENGGMGLLIAKMLLEKMNGSIKLLPSQPGRGPIFAIRVPQGRDT
jgi:signal transduction histidine kinase